MRRALTAVTAAFALAAAAQQAQNCINPELLNGLVFNGESHLQVSVSRGQASFMSGVRLPASLILIGTGVREGGMTTVAYKSTLSSDKAYSTVIDALGADGWAIEGLPGTAATFDVAGSNRQATLCRNDERRYVTVTEFGGMQYINVVQMAPESPRRACNEDRLGSLRGMSPTAMMPRFQFPAGTGIAGSGAGGGSNTLSSTGSRIVSKESAATLLEHLAPQLEQQGWQHAADWSAGGSAGSTWSKTQDGDPAWGMLEIIRVSDGTYDVDFTLALPG